MSEESKHTPGPWRNGFDGHGGIYIEAEDGTFIGYVARGHKGNAAIVTAAPDLLDACYASIGALITVMDEHPWAGEIIESIKKAVRKATEKKAP